MREHAWEALRVALRLPSETTNFAQVVVDCSVSAFPHTGSNRSSLWKSHMARKVDNLLSLLLTISTLISSSSVKRGKNFLKESLATTVYGGIIVSAITYYFWLTTLVSCVTLMLGSAAVDSKGVSNLLFAHTTQNVFYTVEGG